MTAPTLIFPCGHSYSIDNIRSVTNLRCATCAREAKEKRAKVNSGRSPKPVERNLAAYEGRINVPIEGRDPSMDSLPKACSDLLAAIRRDHPYVLEAAERSGRLAVWL